MSEYLIHTWHVALVATSNRTVNCAVFEKTTTLISFIRSLANEDYFQNSFTERFLRNFLCTDSMIEVCTSLFEGIWKLVFTCGSCYKKSKWVFFGTRCIYLLLICVSQFTESRSNPDETRLRKHIFDSENQKDEFTTTPVENVRQVINVTVSIQILKLIALVNIKSSYALFKHFYCFKDNSALSLKQ